MSGKVENFPFEYELMDPEENRALCDYMGGFGYTDYIYIGPKKYFFSKSYLDDAANIYNMSLRPDDVFVTTFPKSGTTWTQDLVWLLQNDLDFEKAKSISLNDRFPFIEFTSLLPPSSAFDFPDSMKLVMKAFSPLSVKQITELQSPRFIKSHLPLSFLPPTLLDTAKVVYVARDPRDVVVSYFHHNRLMKSMDFTTEFKPFFNYFIKGQVMWAPYFSHVLEAWEKRNHPNLLFLFYEDLLEDLAGGIRRVAQFLGKELTEQQVDALNDHLKFDNFKKNKSVNLQEMQENGMFTTYGGFVRKGKKGGWRECFDEGMAAQADKWIKDNLRGTDLRFPQM